VAHCARAPCAVKGGRFHQPWVPTSLEIGGAATLTFGDDRCCGDGHDNGRWGCKPVGLRLGDPVFGRRRAAGGRWCPAAHPDRVASLHGKEHKFRGGLARVGRKIRLATLMLIAGFSKLRDYEAFSSILSGLGLRPVNWCSQSCAQLAELISGAVATGTLVVFSMAALSPLRLVPAVLAIERSQVDLFMLNWSCIYYW
jgi:hypothetical protein